MLNICVSLSFKAISGIIYNILRASKPNRRLTAGSIQFQALVIVQNNRNWPEPDRTAGQPAVGFWSRPLAQQQSQMA